MSDLDCNYESDYISITPDNYSIPASIAVSGDIILTSSMPYSYNYNNTMAISGIASGIDVDYATHLQEYLEKEQIYKDYKIEESLRMNNPGIQAVWEQYRILVELAKEPPNLDND